MTASPPLLRPLRALLLAAALLVALAGCVPPAVLLDDPIVEGLRQGIASGSQSFSHAELDALLVAHVDPSTGLVDYRGLAQKRGELDAYLAKIAAADLARLPREEQLALLINAYNAYTLRLVLEHLGRISSIRDIDDPWSQRRWVVAGRALSLDDIEHGILRPLYRDPRIHFAVNCASMGCPPLHHRAYSGERLSEQLDAAARTVLHDSRFARRDGDTLHLTPLLDWYGEDFTNEEWFSSGTTPADWAADYLPSDIADFVRQHDSDPPVEFLDYDWSLNRQAR